MVLQLQPGERAETRGMPVAELNGQKGTIVCYMESNKRYLLELDDTGKTLSLRKENIKTEGESETETKTETETRNDGGAPKAETAEDEDDDDLLDPIDQMPGVSGVEHQDEEVRDRVYRINDLVWYSRVNGTRSRALIVEGRYAAGRPTYDIRILSSGVSKTTTGKWLTLISSSHSGSPIVREPNLFECLLLKVYDTVSWPTLIVGFLAILWMWPDGSSSSHHESSGSTSHERDEIYYDNYYSYRRWYWSPFYFGYWNCWAFVGGLGSVILVGIFTHKLGTNNGRRRFSWDRAWNALLQMDFWELIRLVAIFEGALYFVGNISSGGRRRR